MDNTYVITFNSIDNSNKLLYEYENISGKTAIYALEKRFNYKFYRAIGDEGAYSDVIIQKGFYDKDTNTIKIKGNYLCFRIKR